jgi:hypothetical protein
VGEASPRIASSAYSTKSICLPHHNIITEKRMQLMDVSRGSSKVQGEKVGGELPYVIEGKENEAALW